MLRCFCFVGSSWEMIYVTLTVPMPIAYARRHENIYALHLLYDLKRSKSYKENGTDVCFIILLQHVRY